MSSKDGVNPNCPAHGCRARSHQGSSAVAGRKVPVVKVGSSALLMCDRPGAPASGTAVQRGVETVTGGVAGLEIRPHADASTKRTVTCKVKKSAVLGAAGVAGKIPKQTATKSTTGTANNPTKKASTSGAPKSNKGGSSVGASGRTSTSETSAAAPKIGTVTSVPSVSSNKADNPDGAPKVAPPAVRRRVVRRVRVIRACAPRG